MAGSRLPYEGAGKRTQTSPRSLRTISVTRLRAWPSAPEPNVKAVQRMLGHASAAMTLDTYADLFDDDLDYVAEALSRARGQQQSRRL